MTQGREVRLRLEHSGDDTRVALSDCNDSDSRRRECSEFCKDAGLCATFLNSTLDSPFFRPVRGPNHIGTHDPPPPVDNLTVCIPNALLKESARRLGSACAPPICDWKGDYSCPYEGSPLPPRPNDSSLSYQMCCDH